MSRRTLYEDIALAVVLAGLGTAEVWVPFSSRQGTGSAPYTTLAVVLACAPLALRRVVPLAAAVATFVTFPVLNEFGDVYILFYGTFVPMGVATYSVARHGRGREPLYGAALAAGLLLYIDLFVPLLQAPGEKLFHWSVFALIWLAGSGLRRTRALDRGRAGRR